MKTPILFLIIPVACMVISCKQKSADLPETDTQISILESDWEVTQPPAKLDLDPFYKKYVNVNGIHVISSWRVPDSAVHMACNIIESMTGYLSPVYLEQLSSLDTRVGIMARYEGTTDIPEHAHLVMDTTLNWDVRARGLGGSMRLPLTTCAEENLLCYQIDKYHAEDILIHEFAHTIHFVGILPLQPKLNEDLQEALDQAISQDKWKGTYAATNIAEYWAEGVQDWFDANAEVPHPDGKHNHINTRKELKEYDPRLFSIISAYFQESDHGVSCHSSSSLY